MKQNNIEIPKEVAVISIGYDKALMYSSPSISRIESTSKSMALKTVDVIIRTINNENINVQDHIIDAKLIIGKSSMSL